ncbi:2Fe-2S ferredoxin-type domain-containing protein [Melampsora americana]|nr:2Fe-2S ferredoxin-type domain-containing protein [Melampsora americana]
MLYKPIRSIQPFYKSIQLTFPKPPSISTNLKPTNPLTFSSLQSFQTSSSKFLQFSFQSINHSLSFFSFPLGVFFLIFDFLILGIQHLSKGRPKAGTGIKLMFKNHKGELIKEVEGNEGDDIVDLSWEWDLDLEAACEKSIACSTCHCIFTREVYDRLPEPTEDEEDMLDLAFGLTDTSRLGCQVKITKEMNGTTITLPSATRNLRVDGSKPTH